MRANRRKKDILGDLERRPVMVLIKKRLTKAGCKVAHDMVFFKDDFMTQTGYCIISLNTGNAIELFEIDSDLFTNMDFHKIINTFTKIADEVELPMIVKWKEGMDRTAFINYFKIYGFKENHEYRALLRLPSIF